MKVYKVIPGAGRRAPLVISVALLFCTVVLGAFMPGRNAHVPELTVPDPGDTAVQALNSKITPALGGEYLAPSGEMKAVWIPFM